ncbi:MAG: histidine kinase, partial [Bacteroidota bacterium]
SQDFIYRHYTTDDGLPSSEAYDLLQDQQGYMWFSTDNGLSRFDGYEFKNFNSKQGLRDQVVFHIKEDSRGRIWMSTLGSKVYILENDSIYPFPYNQLALQYKSDLVRLEDFYIDADDTFYGAYLGLGIIKIDKKGQYELIQDSNPNGTILFQVEGYTLYSYTIIPGNTLIDNERIELNLLKQGDTAKCYRKKLLQRKTRIVNGLGLNEHYQIFDTGDNLLLFNDRNINTSLPSPGYLSATYTTTQEGVLLGFAVQNGAYFYPSIDDLKANRGFQFLKNYSVSEIWEDKAGAWWVTTLDDGVFYIAQPDVKVYQKEHGLLENNVKALTRTDTSSLKIGLLNGAVYDLKEGHIPILSRHIEKEIYDLLFNSTDQFIWYSGITQKRKNRIEFSINKHQVEFDRSDQTSFTARKLKSSPINGIIYACNSGFKGFSKIEQLDQSKRYRMSKMPNSTGWTTDVQEDYNGNIWVGRNDGLYLYKNEHLHFIELGYPNAETRVETIHIMPDSTLVLGTKGEGIILWKKGRLVQLKEKDGLIANEIEVVYLEDEQTIWVGTLEGMNKIQIVDDTTFHLEPFTIYHGLASNEVNDIVALKDRVWVATTRGLSSIPKNKGIDTSTFQPIIDEVLVNNVKGLKLNQLSYKNNNLSIQFKSLDYRQNGQITYRYRLKSDQKWQLGTSTNVNLLALNPGDYRFEVQARNRAGFWSQPALLFFTIEAPFWQQPWFLVLSIVTLSFLIYQWLNRRNEAFQKSLTTEQEINHLRQLALQSQMNPHFVFNCLNAIQGFIADGDSVNSTRYLSKFSNLIRMVLKVSNLSRISIEQEIELLENYLELEQMRFGGLLNYEFILDEKLDQLDTYLPPLLLQPIVENAIIHGFSETQKNYHLKLYFQEINNKVQISIIDNGRGFPMNQSFNNNQHQSLGLNMTERRLALLPQVYGSNSIQMTNLTDRENQIQGAKVVLQLESL